MPGPPKKPTQLKVVEGTLRNAGQLLKEPLPQRFDPGSKPPRWLRGAPAIRAWREMVSHVGILEVATVADIQALAMLCDVFSVYLRARDITDEEGLTWESYNEANGTRMLRMHPAVTIRNESWAQTVRMMQEFGMTPASRAKVVKVPEGNTNPLDAYLSNGTTDD